MKSTVAFFFLIISLNSFAQQKVNFTEKFKKENQGKYKIEINELKELIHIMIAITNSGKENDDMIEQEGKYYQDIRAYFKPFENEKIIQTFDSLMVASLYNYVFLTGNALSYNFKGSKLIKSETFIFPANGLANMTIEKNPITTYKDQIEAFAKKSKFRKFYSDHKSFYNGIIEAYEKQAKLGNQWKWLEKNFETRKDSYLILCSPLIKGFNYTGQFVNNNFSLIHMSLPPVDNMAHLSPLENELLNTRIMFTEIDHNYVGAPTEANRKTIDSVFADRDKWVLKESPGTYAYPNPVNVFNEYMTYAVFILYCKEQYDAATFDKVRKETNIQMTERGFTQMQQFTDKLLSIRAKYPEEKIDNLYGAFLMQFAR